MRSHWTRAFTVTLALAIPVAPLAQVRLKPDAAGKQAKEPPMARIIWLEPAPDAPQERDALPVYRAIDSRDGRLKDYERWIDTEAGRFARRLMYRASGRFGGDPAFPGPVLPIVVKKGGNNGAYGLSIATATGIEQHPTLPYVILDPNPDFLGGTILHESGHLAHRLAVAGRRQTPAWSAFPHTTFATSDPVTALAEGYAIHLETLSGHFGADRSRQAYYRRLAPSFEAGKGRKAEYFAPVDDLMNFAQVWSRYQAVRDAQPAFEGHLYPGMYARTQMDPARDRAQLKSPNAMLASEGVVASVMFWISSALAAERGALPSGGLDQPALIDAEMMLLEAFAAVPPLDAGDFRPDVLDVVEALNRTNEHTGDIAISRFVDVTRGVTARPGLRGQWRALYEAALLLDIDRAKTLVAQLDRERGQIVAAARANPATLRAGVGPVIPVTVRDGTFELKAFGGPMPVEFDLNAMSTAELALLPGVDAEGRARIDRERERAPFASEADFTARTGLSLDRLGLAPPPRRR